MKTITIPQAIAGIEEIFGLTEDSCMHTIGNGVFLIDKRKVSRLEVIDLLQNYFSDKVIMGGGCWVSKITLVFTKFEVADFKRIEELINSCV